MTADLPTPPHPDPADERYNAPLERAFDRIVSPLEAFVHRESASGLVLMAVTALALVLANSPWATSFHHLFQIPISLRAGPLLLEKSLHHWINDALMALFFFVAGLEIKREALVGELADLRQAALPVVAAVGGMAVPALLYGLINQGTPAANGWGIPMATDIAFAVGAIALLGARVPHSLLAFLVALAIADDLGAVAIIALFYTAELNGEALLAAAGASVLLLLANRFGIRRPIPYFLLGGLLWLMLLKSGLHATLAGVLTALAIPARPKYDPQRFSRHVRTLMDHFDARHRPGHGIMDNPEQHAVLLTLRSGVDAVETPLQRLEGTLHLPVAFGVVPLFALANAGVPLTAETLWHDLHAPVTLGVMVGLLVGKPLGIAGACWLALRLGVGQLPTGARFGQLVGVGLLGGIGFTMSIFIGELAFAPAPALLLHAKIGILLASLIAGIAGYLWLRATTRRGPPSAARSSLGSDAASAGYPETPAAPPPHPPATAPGIHPTG